LQNQAHKELNAESSGSGSGSELGKAQGRSKKK
jgi:hypothetical protein